MTDFGSLSIAGRVATSADPDWDELRQGQNLAVDMRPAAIVSAEGPDDVAAAMRFAAAHDLRVAPQSTGHGAGPLASLEDTILLRTGAMNGIGIDAGARTARVEAGVRAAELGAAAGEEGLAFLPGSSPTVGVAGYVLGGGLSWLGRRHGFACNRVSAIELVTADGEVRRVDADEEADLFWALRGGGGGYGIVTALHLDLIELADVYAGALIFPAELGADAVRAARDWAGAIPEEITSNIRFLTPPPLPDVPEPIRGRPLFVVSAACIGTEAEGEQAIAPLREIGEPIMDTFAQIPAPGLSRIDMDPEDPVPSFGHSSVLGELPDEAVEALVEAAGAGSGSPLLLAGLRQLGGALSRPAENGGALDRIDGAFVLLGIGVPMGPNTPEALDSALDRLEKALRPWALEGGYFNFSERPCDVDAILPADTCKRLAEVKRAWDPDDRILANHAVALTTA